MGKCNALWIFFLHNLRFTKWEERDLNQDARWKYKVLVELNLLALYRFVD